MKFQQFLRDVEEVGIYILDFNAKGVVDTHVLHTCNYTSSTFAHINYGRSMCCVMTTDH